MRKRTGFTLIELLVVVAIIAVLISILVPSLKAAREQAKAIVCQSNLRQIGVGIGMYLFSDSNGVYPPYANPTGWPLANRPHQWWPLIGRYVGDDWGAFDGTNWTKKGPYSNGGRGTIGHCPSHTENPGSYSVRANSFIMTDPSGSPVKAIQVKRPAEKELVSEVHTECWIPMASIYSVGWGKPPFAHNPPPFGENTHGKASNHLLCDLHVEAQPLIDREGWDYWHPDW